MKKGLLIALLVFAIAPRSIGADGLDQAVVQKVLDIATAARRSGTDTNAVVAAFNRDMVAAFGRPPTLSIVESKELDIALTLPLAVLWTQVSEQLRKLEKIAASPTAAAIGITVEPKRVDAPNIVKVAVLVGGEPVESIASTFGPTALKNAMGASVTKGAGTILFPESAFDPKNDVRVVIIPETGQNIEMPISKARLAALRIGKMAPSSSLIGVSTAEVKDRLGEPTDTGSGFLRYIRGENRLYVYVDGNGRVTDVNPKDIDLIAFVK
jgi:hypothetical protein